VICNLLSRLKLDSPKELDLSLILRGIFACAVVFWHVIGSPHYGEIPSWLNIPGRVSVWMFFGLSGYVIAHQFFTRRYLFSSNGIFRFYIRRAARILPLFWLASGVAIIGGLWANTDFELTFGNLIKSLLALQWTHSTYLVGVFWTLGVELHFYLIAPILCLPLKKSNRTQWFIGTFALILLVFFFGGRADDRSAIANLHFFMAGILMAKVATSRIFDKALSSSLALPVFIFLGTAAIVFASVLYTVNFWHYRGAILSLVAISAFLAAHRVIEIRKIHPSLIGHCFMYLGLLAYGIYTWHGVISALLPWFQDQFIANFLLSILLSWLSYSLLEKPIVSVISTPFQSSRNTV
jgi:peptidoglycan/LPS O-acetylase OafA/YrhL